MSAVFDSVPGLIVVGSVGVPLVIYALLGTGERMLAGAKHYIGKRLRPWLWLLVPLLLVCLILVYPIVYTIILAFRNATGANWNGLSNLAWVFGSEMRHVLVNNLVWLVAFPGITAFLAVVVAVLFDRVKYEKLAMTLVMLPTAISFSASSLIWLQIYSYQGPGTPTTGLLNELWTLIPGNHPVTWLQTGTLDTFCLIFVALWASLGVASLILSAAVKNVPPELVEAARLDGAGELRIFRSVTLPSILPTVLVVITTEVIFALKIFDIVYVMTDGGFNTDTLANRLYSELFSYDNLGYASAIALVLMVVALPIVILNIRQFRAERRV